VLEIPAPRTWNEENIQMKRNLRLASVALAAGLVLAACGGSDDASAPAAGGDTVTVAPVQNEGGLLAAVKARGTLVCGVSQGLPGFSLQEPDGSYSGFDVDFCRAIAAAVLGDADAVDYVQLTAAARFTALQAGEVDVLVRNTTWTATRDGAEGAAFAFTTFYDGQGMMVGTDSGISSIADMANTTVCVQAGTTTELNLESEFASRGLRYTALTFEENAQLQEAFFEGRCDGWTSDLSQLAAFRGNWPAEQGGPAAVTILADVISKEPLGPLVNDGDSQWFDVVNWATMATVQAEEFGLTSANVDSVRAATNPEESPSIARFLGLADGFDPGLGLDPDWAYNIIKQVGNYEEIYLRNVGPNTPLGLQRGVNSLWSDGGLLYVPPFR
jgi:general L-amino acid transport system substrate-binding protein